MFNQSTNSMLFGFPKEVTLIGKWKSKSMKFIPLTLLSFLLLAPASYATTIRSEKPTVTFNPRPVCADLVGIPRNSDNFTDEEWQNFQDCVNLFYEVDGTL